MQYQSQSGTCFSHYQKQIRVEARAILRRREKRQPVPYAVRVGKPADAVEARDRVENKIKKDGHSLNTGHLFG